MTKFISKIYAFCKYAQKGRISYETAVALIIQEIRKFI